MFRHPKKENYFSKHNKSVASYYWAGFLHRKAPFYFRKDRQKWFMKLEVNPVIEDQLWKFLKCVNTIRKVTDTKGVFKCVNFQAHQWKLDLDKNYKPPFHSDNHELKHIRAFLIGWIDASCCLNYHNGYFSVRLSMITERKKGLFKWYQTYLKKLFMINLKDVDVHLLSQKETDHLISQLMISKELNQLLSDRTKQYCYSFKAAKSVSVN